MEIYAVLFLIIIGFTIVMLPVYVVIKIMLMLTRINKLMPPKVKTYDIHYRPKTDY